jgi:SAM-dependent methyltransferase
MNNNQQPTFYRFWAEDYPEKYESIRSQIDPENEILEALREVGFDNKVVLDLGAGMGHYAATIAQEAREVIALEPSPVLARYIEEGARAHRITNLRAVVENIETTTIPDNYVDEIICTWSYFFGQGDKGLEQALRIIRPGGTIQIIQDAPSGEIYEASDGKDAIDPKWFTDHGFTCKLIPTRWVFPSVPERDDYFDMFKWPERNDFKLDFSFHVNLCRLQKKHE